MLDGNFSAHNPVVSRVKTIEEHRRETRAIVLRKIKHAPFVDSALNGATLTEENAARLKSTMERLRVWNSNLRHADIYPIPVVKEQTVLRLTYEPAPILTKFAMFRGWVRHLITFPKAVQKEDEKTLLTEQIVE